MGSESEAYFTGNFEHWRLKREICLEIVEYIVSFDNIAFELPINLERAARMDGVRRERIIALG